MSDEFLAERLKAARVFVHRDGSDDLILRMTGTSSGDHNFILPRAEFIRLVESLRNDAVTLSTMGSKVS